MKTIALLLVIAASASGIEWSNLYVKWNIRLLDYFRTNSFFQTPRTIDDAVSAGWVEVPGVNTILVTTYCLPDDPRFCVLFDSYGFIAGIQIGVLVNDVEDMQAIWPMANLTSFRIKTMFDIEVWTMTAYTQDPAVIANGGRTSTWDNLTGTEGVWLDRTTGYEKIPRYETDINPEWVQQACIPSMGTHYLYQFNTTLDCTHMDSWFTLYNGGTLVGIGLQGFGVGSTKKRKWYEWVTVPGLKMLLTNAPDCVFDWSGTYGVLSFHVYFVEKPWDITCS